MVEHLYIGQRALNALLVGIAMWLYAMSGLAYGQTPASIIWEAQGHTDEDAIPPTTQYTSGGSTMTVNWSLTTSGGTIIPYSGNDFVSYGGSTRGNTFGNLEVGFDNDANDPNDFFTLELTYNKAIENLVFNVLDIDRGGTNWHDVVEIYFDDGSGFQNASLFPGYWALAGNKVALDDETYAVGWEGTGVNAGNTDPSANIEFDFTGTQIIALRFVYFSGDDSQANPNGQVSGISDMFWAVPLATGPEDHSDAPLTGTLYGNAIHPILPGINLGGSVTAETSGYNSANASGDVDNGVTIPQLYQGTPGIITATVSGAGGYLQGWIDWNDDGDWLDAGEKIATNLQDGNNDGSISIPFNVPVNANTTETIARFRWSTDLGLNYILAASDGEVEDYAVTINTLPIDHSDAPLAGTSYGDASHIIQTGITLGSGVTSELVGYNSPNASGDVDDGISIPALTRGQSGIITATVAGTGGFLQGWIDWNDDGDWADAGEQIATDLQDGDNDGSISIPVTPPASAATSQTIARFRWSTLSGLNSTVQALDGEVEDYALTVQSAPIVYTCPAGLSYSATTSGNAGTIIQDAIDGFQALQGLTQIGLPADASNSARNNNANPTLSLQLEHFVPAGVNLTISIAKNNNGANSDIDTSISPSSGYVTQTTHSTGTQDVLTRLTITVPAGGAEYIRFNRNGGSTWIDGISYVGACIPTPPPDVQADKTVAVYDPTNVGLYALPRNDVIYTITVSNAGDGAVDTDSIKLIDSLPSDIEFWNGDIDAGGPDTYPGTEPVGFTQPTGSGVSLTYGTDIRFGTGTTAPVDFSSCTVAAQDDTYRPDLTFICFNPKGTLAAGDPDPEITLNFRARIK